MAAKETSHDSNSGIPPVAIDLCVMAALEASHNISNRTVCNGSTRGGMAALEASHKGGGVVAKDPPS